MEDTLPCVTSGTQQDPATPRIIRAWVHFKLRFNCFIWNNCCNLRVCCYWGFFSSTETIYCANAIISSYQPTRTHITTCQTDTAVRRWDRNECTHRVELSGSARIPQKIQYQNKGMGKSVKVRQQTYCGNGVPLTFPAVNFWSRDRREPRYWLTSTSQRIRCERSN